MSKRSWEGSRRKALKDGAHRRGLKFDLTLAECKVYFDSICYYCSRPSCGGIDRLDSQGFYAKNNVCACCTKCNFILGDLPKEAKLELRDGLTRIYQKNLIVSWDPASILASKRYQKQKKELASSPIVENERFVDLYA